MKRYSEKQIAAAAIRLREMLPMELGTEMGICIECGAETSPVEPDAEEYLCESCGKHAVFGAEELAMSAGIWE